MFPGVAGVLSMVFIYEEVCGGPIPPKTMLIGLLPGLVADALELQLF